MGIEGGQVVKDDAERPPVGDGVVEDDEMFLLSILDAARVSGGNFLPIPIARADAVGTILDDDHTPVVQVIDGEAVENAGNSGNCGSTPSPCIRFIAVLFRDLRRALISLLKTWAASMVSLFTSAKIFST